jgi:hypothetical protein
MSVKSLRPAIAAIAATLGLAAIASSAQAAPTRVGVLTCEVSGGVGLIITSSKALACTFRPQKGAREAYAGTVRKFGLDVGATSGGRLVWAVYAPTRSWQRGALAGAYTGASADASVGVGGGANVLVGGSNQTISLQPVSVQSQRGVNLALGVSAVELEAAR